MVLLFRISVQLSVKPLLATRSATSRLLEQLAVYFTVLQYSVLYSATVQCYSAVLQLQCSVNYKAYPT